MYWSRIDQGTERRYLVLHTKEQEYVGRDLSPTTRVAKRSATIEVKRPRWQAHHRHRFIESIALFQSNKGEDNKFYHVER